MKKKLILVKTRLQKVDLSKVYTQKVREKFKKRSYSKTIGGPFFCTHPVVEEGRKNHHFVAVENLALIGIDSCLMPLVSQTRLKRLSVLIARQECLKIRNAKFCNSISNAKKV